MEATSRAAAAARGILMAQRQIVAYRTTVNSVDVIPHRAENFRARASARRLRREHNTGGEVSPAITVELRRNITSNGEVARTITSLNYLTAGSPLRLVP